MPPEIDKYGTHKKLHLTKMTPPKMTLSKDIHLVKKFGKVICHRPSEFKREFLNLLYDSGS